MSDHPQPYQKQVEQSPDYSQGKTATTSQYIVNNQQRQNDNSPSPFRGGMGQNNANALATNRSMPGGGYSNVITQQSALQFNQSNQYQTPHQQQQGNLSQTYYIENNNNNAQQQRHTITQGHGAVQSHQISQQIDNINVSNNGYSQGQIVTGQTNLIGGQQQVTLNASNNLRTNAHGYSSHSTIQQQQQNQHTTTTVQRSNLAVPGRETIPINRSVSKAKQSTKVGEKSKAVLVAENRIDQQQYQQVTTQVVEKTYEVEKIYNIDKHVKVPVQKIVEVEVYIEDHARIDELSQRLALLQSQVANFRVQQTTEVIEDGDQLERLMLDQEHYRRLLAQLQNRRPEVTTVEREVPVQVKKIVEREVPMLVDKVNKFENVITTEKIVKIEDTALLAQLQGRLSQLRNQQRQVQVIDKPRVISNIQEVKVPRVQYVDVEQIVDKVVPNIVYVDRPVVQEKIVYKEVPQQNVSVKQVQKPIDVYREQEIEKVVTEYVDVPVIQVVKKQERIDKIVPVLREVYVDQVVERPVPIEVVKEVYIDKPQYIYQDEVHEQVTEQEVYNYIDVPVEQITEIPVGQEYQHLNIIEQIQEYDEIEISYVDVPQTIVVDKIIEEPVEVVNYTEREVIEYQEKRVQYYQDKLEYVDVPVPYTKKVLDFKPRAQQVQVPKIRNVATEYTRTVQRPVEVVQEIQVPKIINKTRQIPREVPRVKQVVEYVERPVYQYRENQINQEVYVEKYVRQERPYDVIVDVVKEVPVPNRRVEVIDVPTYEIKQKVIENYYEVEKIVEVPRQVVKTVEVPYEVVYTVNKVVEKIKEVPVIQYIERPIVQENIINAITEVAVDAPRVVKAQIEAPVSYDVEQPVANIREQKVVETKVQLRDKHQNVDVPRVQRQETTVVVDSIEGVRAPVQVERANVTDNYVDVVEHRLIEKRVDIPRFNKQEKVIDVVETKIQGCEKVYEVPKIEVVEKVNEKDQVSLNISTVSTTIEVPKFSVNHTQKIVPVDFVYNTREEDRSEIIRLEEELERVRNMKQRIQYFENVPVGEKVAREVDALVVEDYKQRTTIMGQSMAQGSSIGGLTFNSGQNIIASQIPGQQTFNSGQNIVASHIPGQSQQVFSSGQAIQSHISGQQQHSIQSKVTQSYSRSDYQHSQLPTHIQPSASNIVNQKEQGLVNDVIKFGQQQYNKLV